MDPRLKNQRSEIEDRDDVILRASGIAKSYRMGDARVEVLRQVDLSIRRGEFVAIEGRSGSGKSTLLHILGALESIDGGSLSFQGRDYSRHTVQSSGMFARLATNRWTNRAKWGFLAAFMICSVVDRVSQDLDIRPLTIACLVAFHVLLFANLGVRLVQAVWADAMERPLARLRNREFGFVFQFYHLLPELNVLENTLLGRMIEHSWLNYWPRRRQLVQRATQVLRQLGLEHRLKHKPSQLSGGERQRVAIARALLNDPQVLFADEPTGNLDAETGRQIMALLEALHREQGQTIVMVTHDRAIARQADRVLLLKDGRLTVDTGPSTEKMCDGR